MDWKKGYFAESGYTYGYYAETSPAHLRWAAALQGQLLAHRLRYLDLGCGQGLSLIAMAVCQPEAEFVGIDFMPEHIAHARGLAALAGVRNVTFIEADFTVLAEDPSALGEFQVVVAHGITTWVSPQVREALFRVAQACLSPGGVMYNSYNTYPGWLSASPFQALVAQRQRSQSGVQSLTQARDTFQQLQAAKSPLFSHMPSLTKRLEGMAKQDPAYLMQEYNNQFWQPVYSPVMLGIASHHKLSFLGSASLLEAFDACYPTDLLQMINAQAAGADRELLRDIAMAQGFRRDVYVKGRCVAWPLRHQAALGEFTFAQSGTKPLPAEDKAFEFSSGQLQAQGKRDTYVKVWEAYGSGATLASVLAQCAPLTLSQTVQVTSLLVHGGWLTFHQAGKYTAAQQLNRQIAEAAWHGAPYRYVVLPSAQTAKAFSDVQLQLLALYLGRMPRAQWPQRLLQQMASVGRAFQHEGQPVTDSAQALAAATRAADDFEQNLLPLLRRTQAVASV